MAKLTLSVDDRIVSAAKKYAHQTGVSISEMVENYFAAVTNPVSPRGRRTPVLNSVRGSLKKADLNEFKKHLAAKYR